MSAQLERVINIYPVAYRRVLAAIYNANNNNVPFQQPSWFSIYYHHNYYYGILTAVDFSYWSYTYIYIYIYIAAVLYLYIPLFIRYANGSRRALICHAADDARLLRRYLNYTIIIVVVDCSNNIIIRTYII